MRCSWTTINNRYRALSELQRGPTSSVYLSRDLHADGALTAVKTFRIESAESWAAVRREFEALRRVHHPSIAAVRSLGRVRAVMLDDGSMVASSAASPPDAAPDNARQPRPGDAFMTFDFIDGLRLRDAFLHLFPASDHLGSAERWHAFCRLVADLLGGLESIHAKGLVHHDIKPDNILVVERDGTRLDFHATIIDFGFAQEETTPLGRNVKGTVPYIAPEVLSGSFADGRSDLYSLGISLVHSIAGRFPFPVDSVDAWIAAVTRPEALPVAPLLDGVPRLLAELLTELVALSPDRRPESATAALEKLERALGVSGAPRRVTLSARPPTVGLEREIEILRNEIEGLSGGESGHALVVVRADEGTSTQPLVDEIEVLGDLFDCTRVGGRARRPARAPYQPLVDALRQIMEHVDVRSSRYRRFKNALACLLPEIEREGPDYTTQMFAAEEARQILIETLGDFILEAARSAPLVIVLEDMHRADADTVSFLVDLVGRIGRSKRHDQVPPLEEVSGEAARTRPAALFVVTYADTPPERLPWLDDAPPETTASVGEAFGELTASGDAVEIVLRPLGWEHTREWLSQRYPGSRVTEGAARRLFEASGGSPRLMDEIVRRIGVEVLASGASPLDATDAEFAFRLPTSVEETAGERIRELEGGERVAAEVLAIARAPLPRRTLLAVIGSLRSEAAGDEREHERHVARLEQQALVQSVPGGAGAELTFAHEVSRTLLLERIDGARRREIHAALLGALCEGGVPATEEAAFHALHAGQPALFVNTQLRSVERYVGARSWRCATEILEDLLRQISALREVGELKSESLDESGVYRSLDEIRWAVLARLGRLYRTRREYARALEKFTVLLSLEDVRPDPDERSELYRVMGEIYQENGDSVNALYFLEKSVRLLENQPASEAKGESLLSLSDFYRKRGQNDRAETAARQALVLLADNEGSDLYARACLRLGKIYYKLNDVTRSLEFTRKSLEAARAADHMPRVLEVVEALGLIYTSRGEYEKALEYFTRGVEIATLLGSKLDLANLSNHIGTIYFNRASHQLAHEYFKRSLELFKAVDDRRGVANSHNNLGLALCLSDDLSGAAESYRNAIEIFTQINDEYGQAAGMNNLAFILELEGKYHEALEYAFRSLEKRKRFNSKSGVAFSYYRIGRIYQDKGELDKARKYAELAFQIRRETGEKMGLAHSRIQIADLLLSRGRLDEALTRCEEGESEFEILENASGRLVARETRARILLRLGDLDAASRLLEDVLAQARQGSQQLLAGRTLLSLAHVSIERDEWSEADSRLERAEAVFERSANVRALAELHLARCRLSLDRGQPQRATAALERAYEILEERGIRDLVPVYFLLRGRLESVGETPDTPRGRKFLERALVESRESSLPDVLWRVQYQLGLVDRELGSAAGARDHFAQARQTLETVARGLSPGRREAFERFHRERAPFAWSPLAEESVDAAPADAPTGHVPGSNGDRARLEQQLRSTRAANERLVRLQVISKAINSERNIEALLEKVMDSVLDLLGGERGFLILKGKDDEPDISVARNPEKKTLREPETEISRSIAAEVIRSGEPVLARNAILDDRFSTSRSVKELRLLSVVCVPLRSRGQVLGALYVDNRIRRSAFGTDDLRLLETFSDQATTAIVNARLTDEIQQRNRELVEMNDQMDVLNQQLLREVRKRTTELARTREHLAEKLSTYESHLRFDNIIGKSTAMQDIFRVLERVAPTSLAVMIQGESGTGKELIARAIHANSPRKQGRFVSENCAALSETLLESELFGHTRGAFTGATADRKGLFELASGGTLFLDEVAEMSLGMQKKLLRVLQEGELRRVGGKESIAVDVRVISASNRDVTALVDSGDFREDLYYRLNGVRLDLPPLRERPEDIPLLVHGFLDQIAREAKLPRKEISEEAVRILMQHSWPGNVRELRHMLERTALLTEESVIEARHCQLDHERSGRRRAPEEGSWRELADLSLPEARDRFVRMYVERCFLQHDSNVTRAAKASGMSRESFHRFLKKFRIRKAGGSGGQSSDRR